MIINFSLLRLSIILLLAILLPLVQKQWLNLYLFNINDFTIYKLLYYLSGLIVPILVTINSLNKFTYYKFNNHNKTRNNYISGKLLLLITFIISTINSILVSFYIFINLKILLNLFISNSQNLIIFDFYKQILFVIIISTFLIFKKTKIFVKKIILTNYFIFSLTIWYLQINNSFLIDVIPNYILRFGNINYINIAFLLAIEIVFYLWAYISYGSNLSDWKVPMPYKKEVSQILNFVMLYFLVILYYSLLFK